MLFNEILLLHFSVAGKAKDETFSFEPFSEENLSCYHFGFPLCDKGGEP